MLLGLSFLLSSDLLLEDSDSLLLTGGLDVPEAECSPGDDVPDYRDGKYRRCESVSLGWVDTSI